VVEPDAVFMNDRPFHFRVTVLARADSG